MPPLTSPFVASFRVREVLPAEPKALAKALRERGIGRLEIKKRGVDVDPAALRTKLKLRGDESATLFITRIGAKRVAILADRVAGAARSSWEALSRRGSRGSRRRAASRRCRARDTMPSTSAHTATARLSSGRRRARIADTIPTSPIGKPQPTNSENDEPADRERERPGGEPAARRRGLRHEPLHERLLASAVPGSAGADSIVTRPAPWAAARSRRGARRAAGDASSASATSGDGGSTAARWLGPAAAPVLEFRRAGPPSTGSGARG